MTIHRQGDVLLVLVSAKELTGKFEKVPLENGRVILAYGESTGHAHALSGKTSTLYRWEGNRLLEVVKETPLVHEEHSAIALAPGVYRVIQQKEYSPQAIRNVMD
jgi:hypothetical protein